MRHIRNRTWAIKNFGFVFLFLVSGLSACRSGIETVDGGDGATDGGGTGGGSGDPPGEVNDSAGFYVKVIDGEKIKYYERRLVTNAPTDFSKECVVKDTSDAANNDIECVIDVPEEDLHFHGISLQHNFPSTMCSYVTTRQFYYRHTYFDTMPTSLRYMKDPNNDYDLVTSTANPPTEIPAGCLGPATILASSCEIPTITPVPHILQGSPKCDWDYSASDGPNCCEGNYTLQAYLWTIDPADATKGKYVLSESTGSWTGKRANCFGGPAFKVADASLNADGMPETKISYVENTGLNAKIDLPSPLSQDSHTHFLANFYSSLFLPVASRDTPTGILGYGYSSPAYEYTCFDRGFEVNARIRVYIQEWNSLNAFINSKTVAGSPDVEGTETGPGGGPINDMDDWDDIEAGAIYPGY